MVGGTFQKPIQLELEVVTGCSPRPIRRWPVVLPAAQRHLRLIAFAFTRHWGNSSGSWAKRCAHYLRLVKAATGPPRKGACSDAASQKNSGVPAASVFLHIYRTRRRCKFLIFLILGQQVRRVILVQGSCWDFHQRSL